jgi:hypothetical protein
MLASSEIENRTKGKASISYVAAPTGQAKAVVEFRSLRLWKNEPRIKPCTTPA